MNCIKSTCEENESHKKINESYETKLINNCANKLCENK